MTGGLLRRELTRDEIGLVWTIDRRELVERVYEVADGELRLKPDYCDIPGWPADETGRSTGLLEAAFARGARFLGIFDQSRLVALGVVDTRLLGLRSDLVQLAFLHVGRDHRGIGLGRELFDAARQIAGDLGANGLYVSATPSEHTIDFYRHRGCVVIDEPDPELFELEPEDIHLECHVARGGDRSESG
jgi:GNAT superfamily N-acetyltransferase